ncbi:MAG: hypothetical protein ACQESP_00485 [Candidatus Muiribacteriota bacterium]
MLLLLISFFQTGCFGGSSPGLQVLSVTGEQYLNDAKRYLRESQFIYDRSKIKSVINNIDDNKPSEGSSVRDDIDLMINFLKIIREYSKIIGRGNRPDSDNIKKIKNNIYSQKGSDYYLLRLLLIYIESFSWEKNTSLDIINLYSLYSFFEKRPDYEFPFLFAGEKIDYKFINYIVSMTLAQNYYFAKAEGLFKTELDKNQVEPIILLAAGEFFLRANLYNKAEKYLKHFRFPVYRDFGLKDYALTLLSNCYEELEKKSEAEVVAAKTELKLRFSVEEIFTFLTEEEKKLYKVILTENNEIELIQDMLGINQTAQNNYLKGDFHEVAFFELTEYYRKKYEEKDFFDEKNGFFSLYTFLKINPEFHEQNNFIFFAQDFIEIMVDESEDSAYYSIKINDNNLRPVENTKFRFNREEFTGRTIDIIIEATMPRKGNVKSLIKMEFED